MAVWLMVWLGSVRSLYMPELRPVGKAMWAELSRGIPYLDEAWEHFSAMFGDFPESLEDEAMDLLENWGSFVPVGLEPVRVPP